MLSRRTLLFTLPPLALGGCAGLGDPHRVTLTQADIERQIERSFPLDKDLLDIFAVTVGRPRVTLQPERNRLAAVVSVRARDRLLFSSWQGQLSFDAGLRWHAQDNTLRLAQVRVQDLALDNPAAVARSAVERLGGALVERVLEDSVVYRLTPERADQLRQAGVTPGEVTVTPRGVEITFVGQRT